MGDQMPQFITDALTWLEWSNPVSLWWGFLVIVSGLNILFWFFTRLILRRATVHAHERNLLHIMIWLSAAYVFGCAFRSVLPRADVQRLCLFDTWFSSVLIGRSVATIAELSFVAQWAVVLNHLAKATETRLVEKISWLIVPLILMAECFSWYGVISTRYLGNVIEESTWAVTYTLIAICSAVLFPKFKGPLKMAAGVAAVGSVLYILFMVTTDVPMYFSRWQADMAAGKSLFHFADGIHDLATRWTVSHNIEDWRQEIPWMSLYFSAAVWASMALCYVPLSKEKLHRHLKLQS
jgi:hypothetical protein